MDTRKRPAALPNSSGLVCWPSLFLRQPPRVLIVEALPPWWSQTGPVLCEALDNFLSLACSLEGPSRIPLLSLYAISRQQECLLPFVHLGGNLARLRSCVEELRSLPGEGCVRAPAQGGGGGDELLRRAVLDSLQQFKQYTRHTSPSGQANSNASLEITVVTSRCGLSVVRQLEAGLKGADLVSLRRLLVVQISAATEDWGLDALTPEDKYTEDDDSLMLGAEVDLQRVDNSAVAVEMVLKAWLHQQGGDREHLHLMLPGRAPGAVGNPSPVCVKCDMQERLLSPALLPLPAPNLGSRTEGAKAPSPPAKASANQSPPPQRLVAVKTLRVEGVCESVLYGLPLVLRPTSCWQLDWDEMESNHNLFHALCHTLRSRDLFLLVRSDTVHGTPSRGPALHSYYILQASPSLSLLMKPVVSRELLLPCPLPGSSQDPLPGAMNTIQGILSQLEEESMFNPLYVNSNLYQHLRNKALLSQPKYPYRMLQGARRPQDGAKTTHTRQPKQVRATVGPLPSPSASSPFFTSCSGPPPSKASRPALTLLSSRARAPAAPASSYPDEEEEEEEEPGGRR